MHEVCTYKSPEGNCCSEPVAENGLCFWHSPSINKSGADVKAKLEAHARAGGMLQGIVLKRANLDGLDLVNRGSKTGFDLSYADLYRAKLKGAHLFNLTIRHGSIMKSDLTDANLHCCDFTNSNLLGVNWKGARIDNIVLGKRLMQEELAYKAGKWRKHEQELDNFEQCEEIYRDLRKAAENQGLFELGGYCIHKELTMRRLQYPPLSWRRVFSKFIDLFCGYGERPLNVIFFSLFLILFFAVAYFVHGSTSGAEQIAFDPAAGWRENLYAFFTSLYFSIVTFTTLGYGDIAPTGFSRIFAAAEALIGSFTIALFVVVFVKKMTR